MTYNPLAYSGRVIIEIEDEFEHSGGTRWLGKVPLVEGNEATDVLVLHHKERYIGLPLLCTHAGAPLTQGTLTDSDTIICPRHGHEYELTGGSGIGFDVSRDGDIFFLTDRSVPETDDVTELKTRIASLEMELEAQRAANSALEQQVISGMENMDQMFSEIEAKNIEWKEKSERLETLNDLVTRVTDSINEIMIIAGPTGKIQRVNHQALEVFQCGQVDFAGRSVDELLSVSDMAQFKEQYDGKINTDLPILYQLCFVEAPFEAEVSLRYRFSMDREAALPHPYLLRGTRLYDRFGKEEGAILVASDISRVKEREFRLRQKEIEKTLRLLQVTLGNIRHGIAVFDENGLLLVCNDSYGTITGCQPEWMAPGTAYGRFLELEESRISLSTLSSYDRDVPKLQAKMASWESYYLDGRVIFCESNMMPDGGFVLVARDVTEQREEAEQIRRLSYAVEQSPVEVIITDTDGMIEYVNAKFTENTGYSREHAVGRKTSMVRSGQTPNQYYDSLWETLQAGNNWSGEVLNKRKDGSLFWQQLSVAPMYDPDGTVRNYLATKENIDERKKAEEELAKHRDHLQDLVDERSRELISAKDEAEKANRAKTEFLSSMSHELRTPLNGILGFAQLLEMNRKEQLTQTQGDYVQQILKAGQHLLDLISEILDLAKIEAGKLTINAAKVDMNQILLESIALVDNMAHVKEISISNLVTLDPLIAVGDMTRIKQTVVNLLSNAVKYNRKGGEVMVTAEFTESDMLALSVTDTGYGIADGKMEDLFTPFNRLGVEGQNIEGSGIGLTITRKLMHMMGGDIRVESEEGVGSTFTLLLPTEHHRDIVQDLHDPLSVVDNDDVGETGAVSKSEKVAYDGRRVLYVEDNWSNQFLVERAILNMPGLTLKCVSDPKIAVELAKKELPDMILMDINLPGMSGYEALTHLQEDEDTEGIPVVAISAKALKSDIEKGLNAGFRGYLTKPINIPNLLETIASVLEERIL